MQRVKNVGYDDDDLYSDDDAYEEEGGDEQGTKAEDRENFAALTPVVRAELAEAGVQVDDGDIEKALWHYYWNVGKSVAYLKNSRTPRTAQPQVKKEKPKSKFDEAAHKSAAKASKLNSHPSTSQDAMMEDSGMYETRGGHNPRDLLALRLLMCFKSMRCQPMSGSRTPPGLDSTQTLSVSLCQHRRRYHVRDC